MGFTSGKFYRIKSDIDPGFLHGARLALGEMVQLVSVFDGKGGDFAEVKDASQVRNEVKPESWQISLTALESVAYDTIDGRTAPDKLGVTMKMPLIKGRWYKVMELHQLHIPGAYLQALEDEANLSYPINPESLFWCRSPGDGPAEDKKVARLGCINVNDPAPEGFVPHGEPHGAIGTSEGMNSGPVGVSEDFDSFRDEINHDPAPLPYRVLKQSSERPDGVVINTVVDFNLSPRAILAAFAMQGILSNPSTGVGAPGAVSVATYAVAHADALLAQLG